MSETSRCLGKTLMGNRCKRTISDDEKFCWQHQNTNNTNNTKNKNVKHSDSSKLNKSSQIKQSEKMNKLKRKIPKVKYAVTTRSKTSTKTYSKFQFCALDCKKMVFKGGLCVDHACHSDDCPKQATAKSIWCSDHKCADEKCNHKRRFGGTSCFFHRCLHNCGCYNLRLIGNFCADHACSVKNCDVGCEIDDKNNKNNKNNNDNNKKYCSTHKKQYALEKPEECPVCLEEFKADEEPWSCGHYVHRSCITKSMKAECPLCRTKLKLTLEEENQIRNRSNREREQQNREAAEILNRQLPLVGFARDQMRILMMLNYMQQSGFDVSAESLGLRYS